MGCGGSKKQDVADPSAVELDVMPWLLQKVIQNVDEDKRVSEAVDAIVHQAIKEELAAQKEANDAKSAIEEEQIAAIVKAREEALAERLAAEAEAARIAVHFY